MALGDVLSSLKPEHKRAKSENPKKYVMFTGDEWKTLEAAAGQTLEVSYVKALVQGIFDGKFNVSHKKP
jgi:hypothetical protein